MLCCLLYSLSDARASGELDELGVDVASLGLSDLEFEVRLLVAEAFPATIENLAILFLRVEEELVDVELEL